MGRDRREFGEVPIVNVIADVSGRHPRDQHIQEFVTALLTRFSGAATDGFTSHMWSLDEILSGHRVEGGIHSSTTRVGTPNEIREMEDH